MLTKLGLLYTPNYGASSGNRTRAVCMASRSTNRYTIPAYRCKKIVQPSYGHHPRVSGSLLTNISSLCSKNIGAGNRSRTCNLLITNQLRCQLRHTGRLVSRGFEPLNAYSLRSNAGLLTTWVSTGNYGPGNGTRTRPTCLEGRDASH